MISRERVERALQHRETDRIPIDFGGCVVTCIDADAHAVLCGHTGLPAETRPIIDYSMGTVEPSEALMRRFHSDVRRVSMNMIPPAIQDDCYTDGFGIRLKRAAGHLYFDVVENPLRDADIDDLDSMRMPDPDDPRLYAGIADKARDLYENSPFAVFADYGVPGFFETSQKLRGYENLACDYLLNPDFIRALYDRLLALQKRFFKNYLAQVGKYARIIGYADDLGMQDRPQISPELYRSVLKPYHREIFKYIHEQADVKIMLHSCGAISSLIDDLIDVGVDIINPLQTCAAGMDPRTIKQSFGDRVTFWGGIDEQKLLPFGTPEEIRENVKSLLDIMSPGGGYVAAISHNIQADTPSQNVAAAFDALCGH